MARTNGPAGGDKDLPEIPDDDDQEPEVEPDEEYSEESSEYYEEELSSDDVDLDDMYG